MCELKFKPHEMTSCVFLTWISLKMDVRKFKKLGWRRRRGDKIPLAPTSTHFFKSLSTHFSHIFKWLTFQFIPFVQRLCVRCLERSVLERFGIRTFARAIIRIIYIFFKSHRFLIRDIVLYYFIKKKYHSTLQ